MRLTEVLRGGRQCDEDGAEIIMSRQACVEAADMIDRMYQALTTANQALLEVRQAQACGAEWYTNGASGLRQQVATWVNRGLAEIHPILQSMTTESVPQS